MALCKSGMEDNTSVSLLFYIKRVEVSQLVSHDVSLGFKFLEKTTDSKMN